MEVREMRMLEIEVVGCMELMMGVDMGMRFERQPFWNGDSMDYAVFY